MLGPAKPRRLDKPIAVSLEELVPAGNFYRHLEAKLDLSFVRDWARECYAERGRPSIDPVVFFKLQLVMFFEGIRSERQLIATASLNLGHRWYLGYALDESLPDHSSLTRIRQRLGVDVFQRFFEQVVDLCQEAGLVWGRELYVDATNVEANADVDSLIPRFYHDAKTHVTGLFAADPASDEHDDAADPLAGEEGVSPEGVMRLPPGVLPAVAASQQAPRRKLLEERRLDPTRPAVGSYRRTTDFRVSVTDPDAAPMRSGTETALGYHDHYVVDGGKARIVLAALVTPADVMENVPLLDLLWRVCFRRKIWPHQVTGDTTYGTTENIVALEDVGIRAFFPLPDLERRTPYYGASRFTYDAQRDEYQCPQGQPLPRRKTKYTEQEVLYQAAAATCNTCTVKAECTTSDHGRMVNRFAEAKEWHGLRRLRLRGLRNANIQGLLIAAGQNLKRLLAASGWGRRNAPCGSLVALPRERWGFSTSYG